MHLTEGNETRCALFGLSRCKSFREVMVTRSNFFSLCAADAAAGEKEVI